MTIAPSAARAFKEARHWLLQAGAGPDGTSRWQAIRDVRRNLKVHPYLGTASTEAAGHRRVTISGYRLIYQIDPDTGYERTAGNIRNVALFDPGQE